jgi:hypothetical protein
VKQPDGSYALAATSVSPIPVGDGASVQANESASRVLRADGKDTLAVLSAIATALQAESYDPASLDTALDDLSAASEQVSSIQASLGARASRVDLETRGHPPVDRGHRHHDGDHRIAEDDDDPVGDSGELLEAQRAVAVRLSSLSAFIERIGRVR